jgi:hypothetical protein
MEGLAKIPHLCQHQLVQKLVFECGARVDGPEELRSLSHQVIHERCSLGEGSLPLDKQATPRLPSSCTKPANVVEK